MLARLQNQPKNNADIGAVCAACRVRGRDDGIGRDILTKNSNSHNLLEWPSRLTTKTDQGRPLSAITQKNHGIYAVQALTLFPNL
jgi:hypothetical protein